MRIINPVISLFSKIRFSLKIYSFFHPAIFYFYYSLTKKNKKLLVNKETTLVLDGYQSSANTFAYNKFRDYLPKGIKIAHHLHHPGQFLIGIKRKIPCVVLIRNPLEAIPSVIIRFPQKNISQYLLEYISFYKAILPFKNEVFIADFEDIINNFPDMINDFESFYKKRIQVNYTGEKRDDKTILEQIETNTRKKVKDFDSDKPSVPNEERNKKKEKVKSTLMSEQYKNQRELAMKIYFEFVNRI